MKIYAYKNGSKSAKALADALGIKRIKHEGAPLDMNGTTLINWGASRVVRPINNAIVLNVPDAIAKASNKLESFFAFQAHDVPCPEWTTDIVQAGEWIEQGHSVVQRNILNGHSGAGIEIVGPDEGPGGLTGAPLYTKYVKKKEEYRIHVFRDEVIFLQRKARKKDVPDEQVNWKVRNLAGGFIFANQDIEVPDAFKEAACKAVSSLGLDFGAVDIVFGTNGKPYVLEVNTACGLEGSTIDAYVAKFKEFA